MPLCDTLLRCAEEPALFNGLWSHETLEELRRTLVKFGFSIAQAERRVSSMQAAFPEACVQVTSSFLNAVPEIPDPGDRHVVAAAMQQGARTIVTFNLRHFPQPALGPLGILVQSPDAFLVENFALNPGRMLEVLDAQASGIGRTRAEVLLRLKTGVPKFAKMVSDW